MNYPSNRSRYQLLELSGYLENYLWKYFSDKSSTEHVFSIILMVNEKFRADSYSLVFNNIASDAEKISSLIENAIDIYLNHAGLDEWMTENFLLFLVHLFRSLECANIKKNILRYVSLPIWESLTQQRLEVELDRSHALRDNWNRFQMHKNSLSSQSSIEVEKKGNNKGKSEKRKKNESSAVVTSTTVTKDNSDLIKAMSRDGSLLPTIINRYLEILADSTPALSSLKLVERTAELIAELLTQISTRRFLVSLLDDKQFVLRSKASFLLQSEESKVIRSKLEIIDMYLHFAIDQETGRPLTIQEQTEAQNNIISQLQQIAFSEFNEKLKDLVFSSMGIISKRPHLERLLALCNNEDLITIANKMKIWGRPISATDTSEMAILKEVIFDKVCTRSLHSEIFDSMTLYPNEEFLWDGNSLPLSSSYQADQVLPFPRLNLQFLSMGDYLLRNFLLCRLESAFEIREDIVDAVKRLGPKQTHLGSVAFNGWARMALPIVSLSVDQVMKPLVGEIIPRRVDFSVTVDLSRFSGEIRNEWEDLREHDGKLHYF